VPQAYSRACAVFGGTYMLRTAVVGVDDAGAGAAGGGALLSLRTAGGAALRARAVASTAAYLPRAAWLALPPARAALGAAVALVSPPLAAAPGCSAGAAPADLLRGRDAAGARALLTLVIPPRAAGLGNAAAVFVLQQGAGNAMTPDAACATLNVWTQEALADHGGDAAAARAAAVDVARRALLLLLGGGGGGGGGGDEDAPPALLHAQLLSYHGRDAGAAGAAAAAPRGWHVLAGRSAEVARMTSEFDAAEALRVFSRVCPGKSFLCKEDADRLAAAAAAASAAATADASDGGGAPTPTPAGDDLEADLACLREGGDDF
jgi:hypothetical protein